MVFHRCIGYLLEYGSLLDRIISFKPYFKILYLIYPSFIHLLW